MKKVIIPLLIVCIGVLLWAVMGLKKEVEIEPQIVLAYAENQQADYPTTRGAKLFSELVEERTEGRIKIVVFDSGALGTETDVLVQMKYGGVDMARVSISQLSNYASELNVLQMPYLYRNSEHMWKVLDGEIGQEFLDNISSKDFVGLSWYDAGARSFYTKRPIKCMEDIQGMTIRVQGSELMMDVVKALGAKPMTYDYAAVYSALQTGSVDGAENNWPSYESMQHYLVAPYYTEDEHTRVPEMQIVSAHTWNKISDEDKRIIKECAVESALYERQLWAQQEKEAKSKSYKGGTIVYMISEEEKLRFKEAMSGVYEKYCKDYMDVIDAISAQ